LPSAPVQTQPQTLPQSSKPLQDQINQQDVGNITQSISVEPTSHSLPKLPNNGGGGWTNDNMAELEKELELALVEQVIGQRTKLPTSSLGRGFTG
jgi:hypothetical protein